MRICCYSSKLLFHNGVNVLISTGETLEIPVKTFKVLMLHVETNCHYVHSRSFAECPIKASNFKDHKIPITNFSPDCFIYADVLQLLTFSSIARLSYCKIIAQNSNIWTCYKTPHQTHKRNLETFKSYKTHFHIAL